MKKVNKISTNVIDHPDWNDPVDLELRINGEVVDTVPLSRNLDEKKLIRLATSILNSKLKDKVIKKTIFVPLKGINFVVEERK